MPMHLKIGSTVSRRPPIAPRLAPIYQAMKCLRRRRQRGQQQRRINEKSRRLPTFRPRPPSFTYSTSSHSSQPPRAAPLYLLWVFRVDATTCVLSPRSGPKFRNSTNERWWELRTESGTVSLIASTTLSRIGAIAGVGRVWCQTSRQITTRSSGRRRILSRRDVPSVLPSFLPRCLTRPCPSFVSASFGGG